MIYKLNKSKVYQFLMEIKGTLEEETNASQRNTQENLYNRSSYKYKA